MQSTKLLSGGIAVSRLAFKILTFKKHGKCYHWSSLQLKHTPFKLLISSLPFFMQPLPVSVHVVSTVPGPFSGAGDARGDLMCILKVDT